MRVLVDMHRALLVIRGRAQELLERLLLISLRALQIALLPRDELRSDHSSEWVGLHLTAGIVNQFRALF